MVSQGGGLKDEVRSQDFPIRSAAFVVEVVTMEFQRWES
jgi:hypothetical protein